MTTPEPGAGLRAIINHVPETMTATHAVLCHMMTTFGSDMAYAEHISMDKFNEWMALTATWVNILENRLERLEGRPGMPDGALDSILHEFGD